MRLWQLVLAQRKPGFDPTCECDLTGKIFGAFLSLPVSYLVNETPAALWAIVELNLWVIVASIPTLRPLITKTLRDRRARSNASGSKSSTYGSGSMKRLKAQLWHSKGRSSTQSDGRLPLDSEDVQVSAPNSRERGWTPLYDAKNGKDSVQLQALGKIRVDREFNVSQPASVYQPV